MKRSLKVIAGLLIVTAVVAAAYLVTQPPQATRPFFVAPNGIALFVGVVFLAVCFFAAIYWLMYLAMTVERRRAARGLCRRCGYSLTGNVSGVCPEMFSRL
jgi:hypothetical protein